MQKLEKVLWGGAKACAALFFGILILTIWRDAHTSNTTAQSVHSK